MKFELKSTASEAMAEVRLVTAKCRSRWSVYIPGFALFVGLCQVVIEGARWQMIPAYVFISILFLISLGQIFGPKKEQSRNPSILKSILRITVILIAFLLFFITLVPPLAVPMFKIPHPSGKFEVGSSILFFRDTTRIDAFSNEENRFSERSWGSTSPGLIWMIMIPWM